MATLIVKNASSSFVKAIKELAKIDGAIISTKREKKSPIIEALEEVNRGETEKFATLDDFKRAMQS